MTICLTGGTGFVGRNMVRRLVAEGHAVRALARNVPPEGFGRIQAARNEGSIEWVSGDVVSGAGLDDAMQGCDAVIHLVGIIVEKGTNTFERVHHLGTRNVVEAARRAGIKRLVHMSALGVRADGVAAYQTSKWRGEEEVRKSGLPYCILRPSLIFARGDGFVRQMMDVMRKAPLFRPVPGNGKAKFRPIWVDDVTFCFASALTNAAATNQTIELGGADELTLDDVLAEIARWAGVRKPAVHVPLPLMMAGALLAQVLPNPPVTVDQLRMLREGSTCDIAPMTRIFGFQPKGFKAAAT
ncbi:MAG TPA: complex I NDUFA9 subunit family protein [Candidatus Limnocylindrales bacterium]|nr:complex I NDUFA9 subunit family protein [Candidatus Limnocylindrales bacterium]